MRAGTFKYINIGLGLCIILALGLAARQYMLLNYQHKDDIVGTAAADASLKERPHKGGTDVFKSIAASRVFGKADFSLIEHGAPDETVKGATLEDELTLIGTVVGPRAASFAIFEDNTTRKQEVILLGEKVFDAGVLEKIEKDKAGVNVNGRIVTIHMPEDRPPKKDKALKTQTGPAGLVGVAGGITRKNDEGGFVIDQRALETVLGNMGKVLTDARLMPYSEEGKISGFKISEIKQGGVFSLIGLREGDVLVKVNDYAIDSPEKGVQLLTGLKGETSLTLDIIRNNKAKQLHYQIQ